MDLDQLPFLLPYFLSLAITTGVGVFTWQRRRVPGGTAFAVAVFFQSSMTLGYIFELASNSLAAKIFWDNFQWLGTVIAPAAILLFALDYSGKRPQHPRRAWAAALTIPAIFLLLLATNSWHGWVRPEATLIPGDPFSVLVYDFTPLVYAISLYIYSAVLAAVYFLLRLVVGGQSIYRGQAVAVILGVITPLLGGVLTLADVTLPLQRDMTPLTFAIGNLIIAWGLFRYRLFDVTPVAWETVVSHIRDAVIVLDAQNRVVDLNPSARALIPQTGSGVIGQPVTEFLAEWPDTVAKFLDIEKASAELSLGTGSERVDLEIDIVPLYGRRQRYLDRVVVLHDITDRKRTEAALRQRGQELEATNQRLEAARQTAEAARQTAEAARQRAEAADRVKSQFLASMSHELRTPLNAIINFTEMIALGMVGSVSEEQKELLEQSLLGSKHLLHLINDVLDISRIQSGKLTLFVEDNVHLQAELAPVLAMVEPMLEGRPVRLVQDIDPDLPAIAGDKRRLRQIMLNLLTNAAKFTDEGTVTLALKKRADHILLAVTDTGPGIDAEMQTLIFEPFVQTKDGLKHAHGTGLGLPITKSLVEAHGGELWFESEPDAGASFFVRLPVRATSVAGDGGAAVATSAD